MTRARADALLGELAPRLDRGRVLIDELHQATVDWRKSIRYSVSMRDDAFGWYAAVESRHPLELGEWGVRLGEIAHHYRSVLNTLLTRIADLEGLPRSGALQYPVDLSLSAWKKNGAVRTRKLPQRIRDYIYASQPFMMSRQHGKAPELDVLYVLAWLNNEDKHRLELLPELTEQSVAPKFRPLYADPSLNLALPDVTIEYDLSLEIGSHLIEVITPERLVGVSEVEFDHWVDVGFRDSEGNVTAVGTLLKEIRDASLRTIFELIQVWADVDFDSSRIGGTSRHLPGAAFGKAAVNSIAGRDAWGEDYFRNIERQAANLAAFEELRRKVNLDTMNP